MASDLKIEIFAYKFFHRIWYNMQVIEVEPDILEIFGDECTRDVSYMEACDDLIIKAVFCRGDLLSEIYMSSISIEEMRNVKSLFEVYDFVVRMCERNDLFGHLTVFERMLATSDFVANICYFIHTEVDCFIDVLRYGHMLWVMYFDKFIEEFYIEGGWNKLQIVAKSYCLLNELFRFFFFEDEPLYLKSSKEASVNYHYFEAALQCHAYVKRRGCISMSWIKFRIQHFDSFIRIPVDYEYSTDAYEADILLEDLKLLCDPSSSNKIYCDRATKVSHQESSVSTEMVNNFEHICGINNTFCNKFSNSSKEFEKKLKKEYLISNTEEKGFDIAHNDGNIELDKNIFTKIGMSQFTNTSQGLVENSLHKQNFLPCLPADRLKASQNLSNFVTEIKSEEFCSRNMKGKNEMAVTAEVFSINQKIESKVKYNRDTATKSFDNPRHIGFVNEGLNSEGEIQDTKEKLEVNFYSKNEVPSEAAETLNISPTNQTTTSNLFTHKEFSHGNQHVNHEDEMKNTIENLKVRFYLENGERTSEFTTGDVCISQMTASKYNGTDGILKAQVDLRDEQEDLEIKNFLRLILVLGDKQGMRFVRSTFGGNKENPVNSQERSNKRKKRSKNKKARK